MTPTSVITFLLIAAIAIAFFGSEQFKKDVKNIFKYKTEELPPLKMKEKPKLKNLQIEFNFFANVSYLSV